MSRSARSPTWWVAFALGLALAAAASAEPQRWFHQNDRVYIRQREQFVRILEPHVHLERARRSFSSGQLGIAADELERAAGGFAYFAERAAGEERRELETAERGLQKLADDVRAGRVGEITNLERALADAERILAKGPPPEAGEKAPEAK